MKKLFTMIALVAMSLFVFTACEEREEQQDNKISGMNNGHEYVDLGLSVKWATCNVGAKSPEEDGDYFAWGEVAPKEIYDWDTYKYGNVEYRYLEYPASGGVYGYEYVPIVTKYKKSDGKTILDLKDDAARVNWGGAWRIPSPEEVQELIDNCIWTWVEKDGIAGYKITSLVANHTDCSIFLPVTEEGEEGKLCGNYWLNSLSFDDAYYGYQTGSLNCAWCMWFDSDDMEVGDWEIRCSGLTIRPVCE